MQLTNQAYREILEKLYLLSELKPGKTLSVSQMTVIDHTFLASWYRWWYEEDRHCTVKTIGDIIDQVRVFLDTNTAIETPLISDTEKQSILEALAKAQNGIKSLLETYKNDAKICSQVNTILVNINHIYDYYFNGTLKKRIGSFSNLGLLLGHNKINSTANKADNNS